jgi:hypothetical protein
VIGGVGPEALACAVLAQAWADTLRVARRSNGNHTAPRDADVDEAWALLTDRDGEWADARETWCAIAGLCPDALRDRAVARCAAC